MCIKEKTENAEAKKVMGLCSFLMLHFFCVEGLMARLVDPTCLHTLGSISSDFGRNDDAVPTSVVLVKGRLASWKDGGENPSESPLVSTVYSHVHPPNLPRGPTHYRDISVANHSTHSHVLAGVGLDGYPYLLNRSLEFDVPADRGGADAYPTTIEAFSRLSIRAYIAHQVPIEGFQGSPHFRRLQIRHLDQLRSMERYGEKLGPSCSGGTCHPKGSVNEKRPPFPYNPHFYQLTALSQSGRVYQATLAWGGDIQLPKLVQDWNEVPTASRIRAVLSLPSGLWAISQEGVFGRLVDDGLAPISVPTDSIWIANNLSGYELKTKDDTAVIRIWFSVDNKYDLASNSQLYLYDSRRNYPELEEFQPSFRIRNLSVSAQFSSSSEEPKPIPSWYRRPTDRIPNAVERVVAVPTSWDGKNMPVFGITDSGWQRLPDRFPSPERLRLKSETLQDSDPSLDPPGSEPYPGQG